MSVHVDDVFMVGNQYILEKINDKIKPDFSIQDYRKVKKFLRLYHEWGHYAKGLYAKMTTEEDVKKLIEGYNNNTRDEVKVQKHPGAPGTNTIKSDLEELQDINNYR